MRFGAGLPRAKFALLSRLGTACRTVDSEYLFGAEFSFHGKRIPQTHLFKMVDLDQWHENRPFTGCRLRCKLDLAKTI